MEHLRRLLLETELTEEYKWSQPCYTLNGKNVLILTAFKDYCCLAFFKGSLLKDTHQLLVTPGEHSQAARQLRYTSTAEVIRDKALIRAYIQDAIELEKSGAKVEFNQKNELELAEELLRKMNEDQAFKKAFEALTPGRQRGYHLYFSSPKQSATRTSRIEKCMPRIFEGKGWNER